jgi:hypothetical protein
MNKLFFISVFAFSLVASLAFGAVGDGTYGNEDTYGNFSYGVSSASSGSSSNASVSFPANATVTFDGIETTNTTLNIVTNNGVTGSVTIVQYTSTPPGVGSSSSASINQFVSIDVASIIQNAMNYSLITVYYTESEVSDANVAEGSLRLSRWNGTQWVTFDGEGIGGVNTVDNYVWANTSHFSTWGVFGNTNPAPVTATSSKSTGSGGGGSSFKYDCTSWSACTVDGIQTRTCTNVGSSPGDYQKPAEKQTCTYQLPVDAAAESSDESSDETQNTESSAPSSQETKTESKGFLGTGFAVAKNVVNGATNSALGWSVTLLVAATLLGTIIFNRMGGFPGTDEFTRASRLHKQALVAHQKGNYAKAESLRKKAQTLREKAEHTSFDPKQ